MNRGCQAIIDSVGYDYGYRRVFVVIMDLGYAIV